MTPDLHLTLPLPPSVNHSHRPNGRGGRVLTPDTARWHTAAGLLVRNGAILAGWPLTIANGAWRRQRWTITVTYCLSNWLADMANMDKALHDALARALGLDDRYLVGYAVTRESVPVGSEGVTVTVRLVEMPTLTRPGGRGTGAGGML